jgi:branched-chain amino acid aminotransferase
MSGALAWLNGQLIPRDQATLAIADAGLVFGATVTDFCRTFHHKLFRWTDHLERFRNDCRTCFIPLLLEDAELTAIAHDLVERNSRLLEPHQELALISFATPGPIGVYAGTPGQDGPPTVCLHTIGLSFERYRSFFAQGVSLGTICHDATLASLTPASSKHRSRLHWWRAGHLLRQQSASPIPAGALPLLIDSAGHVLETAIGNVLVVLDGTVCSPPGGTVLDGISLRVIEEMCGQLGIPFARRFLALEDCWAASEAMLCGSAFCLAGVRWIDGRELPWPGAITQRLLAAWSERVGINIALQILSIR